MYREIKFRGKSAKNGQWLHGYLGEVKTLVLNTPHTEKVIFRNLASFNTDNFYYVVNDYAVDENTIGQFTGLYDSYGREIYEDDIVKVCEYHNNAIQLFSADEIKQLPYEDVRGVKTKEYIDTVRCDESCFFVGDTYLCAFHGDMRLSFPVFEIKVIGNIHDNRYLLEE